MYESFFGFTDRPFSATPRAERYFPASEIEQSRQTLMRSVESGAGPGLIVGPPGTGKTLLCEMLAVHFRNTFNVVTLSTPSIETPKELLQTILFELQLPYKGMEESELRLSLIESLQPANLDSRALVLLVDEAHNLPLRLLEEIRLITNLVHDGRPRVRLVLAGDPSLEEKFADPKLESFNQRIVARCYLHSFNRDETLQYIQSQLSQVGGNPTLFQHDAQNAIHDASDGVPRLINQIADHALLLASMGDKHQLDLRAIEEAWSDLQQLPAPWQSEQTMDNAPSSNVVEFGSLDSEDDYQLAETGQPSPAELEFEPHDEIELGNMVAEESAIEEPMAPEAISDVPTLPVEDPFAEPFEEQHEVIDPYLPLESTQLQVSIVGENVEQNVDLEFESHDANSYEWSMPIGEEIEGNSADELGVESLSNPESVRQGAPELVIEPQPTVARHPPATVQDWMLDAVQQGTPVEVVNDDSQQLSDESLPLPQILEVVPVDDPVLPESNHWNQSGSGEPAIVPFQELSTDSPEPTREATTEPTVLEAMSSELMEPSLDPPVESIVKDPAEFPIVTEGDYSAEESVSEQVSEMREMLPDDRDLLVVTEDEEVAQIVDEPIIDDAASPVRRQSYGQLFAKLRRG